MESYSVAYNYNPAGMSGVMPGMQGMQGMAGMQGMPGMMHGAPMAGAPGMYPPSGLVNLDVDADPGLATLDLGGPMPCPHCVPHVPHHCPAPVVAVPAPEVYVVLKGDSVYKIAQRYNVSMQAIILANNLQNPVLIYPGQILVIPR